MLKVFWYFINIALLSILFSTILDSNGTVIIDWLDYQVSTDVLTVILILIFYRSNLRILKLFHTVFPLIVGHTYPSSKVYYLIPFFQS